MSGLTIITNNVPRLIVDGYELSPAEREEFNYIDWAKVESGEETPPVFVRYKGDLVDLSDMERGFGSTYNPFPGWDNYRSDSFFSGIVVRYVPDDDDRVVVGRYFS